MFKKHALAEAGSLSSPEPCRRKGRTSPGASRKGQHVFDARSVFSVREHGKMATCLREAAFSLRSHFGEGGTAKAGNAAGLPAVALV